MVLKGLWYSARLWFSLAACKAILWHPLTIFILPWAHHTLNIIYHLKNCALVMLVAMVWGDQLLSPMHCLQNCTLIIQSRESSSKRDLVHRSLHEPFQKQNCLCTWPLVYLDEAFPVFGSSVQKAFDKLIGQNYNVIKALKEVSIYTLVT